MMNEHTGRTEVPYSKRCEFCGSQVSIATLYADNQVSPTFSVSACAGCLNELIHGHTLSDVFKWSWCIDESQRVTAIATLPPRASDRESNNHPTLIQEVRDLARAVQDYHLGLHTTRPYAQTYGRDEALLFRAMSWLGEDSEKGVPDE